MSLNFGATVALCFCAIQAARRKPETVKGTSNSVSGLVSGVSLHWRSAGFPEDQIKLRKIMKAIHCMRAGMAVFACAGMFAGAFLFAPALNAQRTAATSAAAQSKAMAEGGNHSLYDASREVSLQGTVAKFTENSTDFPPGAHVLVQTSSGQTDVHLGNPRLLKSNNMTIAQGASIRIVGEPVTTNQGTFFLARLVQIGTQVVAVRSTTGIPLMRSGARVTASASDSQGGAR
jgi:hypothetical protein